MHCGRANLVAPLAVLISCASLPGADGPDIASNSSGEELIGFTHAGEMIVLRKVHDEGAAHDSIDSIVLPKGPRTTLVRAKSLGNVRIASLIDTEGWILPNRVTERNRSARLPFSIQFEIDAALGDRSEARMIALFDHTSDGNIWIRRIPLDGELELGPMFQSPDERWLVIGERQGHRASLHVIDIRETHAALLNQRALEAYAEGDRARAASILEEAIAADSRAGDPVYNLACVHALMGDEARAAAELQIALAIDPGRYSRLARTDPDLERIRVRPEVCSLLTSCTPGSE